MSPVFERSAPHILPNQDTVHVNPATAVEGSSDQKSHQIDLNSYATSVKYEDQTMTSDSDTSSVKAPVAYETNFERLVEDIKRILGPSSGINSADVDVEDLMATMREYDCSDEHEWEHFALNDPSRNYCRNGVDDINHKANLLILVWNQGKGSMIHDHANAHCIVKMLKGTLKEELYNPPINADKPSELTLKKVSVYSTNEVSYMSDEIGLHRMINPSETELAVSLHLYTPPYASKFGCNVFNEDGSSHKVNLSNLYSNKGVLCTSFKSHSC